MINEVLAAQFESVRARIEVEIKPHSLIMVTSALADDGAALTAQGLVECLAAAGYSTALVDAGKRAGRSTDECFTSDRRGDFPTYALPWDVAASTRSRAAAEAFSGQLRETFEYVVVNAPPFGRQSATSTLIPNMDAVILTVRLARQPCGSDAFMMRSIDAALTYVLGVIAVDSASIAHFEEIRCSEYVSPRAPRLAVRPANGTIGAMQVRLRQAQ